MSLFENSRQMPVGDLKNDDSSFCLLCTYEKNVLSLKGILFDLMDAGILNNMSKL